MSGAPRLGLAGTLARAFIGSRLTPLLVVGSVLVGLLAIVVLPREEEPQIKVPVFDIFVVPHPVPVPRMATAITSRPGAAIRPTASRSRDRRVLARMGPAS